MKVSLRREYVLATLIDNAEDEFEIEELRELDDSELIDAFIGGGYFGDEYDFIGFEEFEETGIFSFDIPEGVEHVDYEIVSIVTGQPIDLPTYVKHLK